MKSREDAKEQVDADLGGPRRAGGADLAGRLNANTEVLGMAKYSE